MTVYNRIAAQDLGRIAALSDGIFAFAMTVLVLEIHIPDSSTFIRRPTFGRASPRSRRASSPGCSA